MSAGSIGTVLDRGVLRVILRRPPLNVIDLAATRELRGAIEKAAGEEGIRAVLFAGEGKAFSAGVNVADHLPDKVRDILSEFCGIFAALENLGVPTIARVHGPALGGGCELAGACDWVFATPQATFGFPEINLAAFPPVAAACFSPLIGYRKNAELVLTGRILTAEEAERIGLVSHLCTSEEIDRRIESLLDLLRGKSLLALKLARRALRQSVGKPPAAALADAERLYINELADSQDAKEGILAFMEKRKPVWRPA